MPEHRSLGAIFGYLPAGQVVQSNWSKLNVPAGQVVPGLEALSIEQS